MKHISRPSSREGTLAQPDSFQPLKRIVSESIHAACPSAKPRFEPPMWRVCCFRTVTSVANLPSPPKHMLRGLHAAATVALPQLDWFEQLPESLPHWVMR